MNPRAPGAWCGTWQRSGVVEGVKRENTTPNDDDSSQKGAVAVNDNSIAGDSSGVGIGSSSGIDSSSSTIINLPESRKRPADGELDQQKAKKGSGQKHAKTVRRSDSKSQKSQNVSESFFKHPRLTMENFDSFKYKACPVKNPLFALFKLNSVCAVLCGGCGLDKTSRSAAINIQARYIMCSSCYGLALARSK
ncbi:hypothetical protein B484DRAFT_184894 [Ochromonadaceae sp. CCMP2298]|nr:hypothetical protein B484DRAFT_184894 [Ochromonadaceae sp. CCMP2298]|mmetsp:Transcript_23141/g.50034  ORF Transcript_23141/g.50034 Transcript_23141/m.50034 type:complete len:193 (-) Transcript_23141:267-845(-)|eukprot:CAMPEP_0173186356 /NCGR_PEP_ID=MMETSP1141-20130122/10096_1 /TAXON_ID=483371 /ORGANISM="non described non described, Strain CCMP2298" /LENGTH=192 /DNA_ID=CAMNT_0014110049 /DNA_START=73 /DNA_END=651 /DNA_ORIENTATION=+